MDASPTERQSTGTVSLLDDGPQRSTSVVLCVRACVRVCVCVCACECVCVCVCVCV